MSSLRYVLVTCAACTATPPGPPALPKIAEIPAFVDTNPDPHIVEVELNASETTVEMVPGYQTNVMAYNGLVPGPLLEAHVGDRVIVHFENDLAEPTTIHWHGLRISSDMDGNPMIQPPIPPGGTFTYDFTVPDAGTFWFHPHFLSIEQIERGLYGAILVVGDKEPKFSAERVFVLDDIRLDPDNQISKFETSGMDLMMGRFGNTLLVNGQTTAIAGVTPQRSVERWHLVNAAGARVMTVSVQGASWRVIASDGGLLPEPYTANTIDIAPGQRYDLEVIYDQAVPSVKLLNYQPVDANGTLKPFTMAEYTIQGDDPKSSYPVYPVVDLPAMPDSPIEKQITLGANNTSYTINGLAGDQVPVDQYTQNVPVRFTIVNQLGMYHPFHMHGNFFQILTRDGKPANEPGLKDTVLIDGGETVTIMTYFENPGMWMYHCHIPEHSENGMMAELEVLPQ